MGPRTWMGAQLLFVLLPMGFVMVVMLHLTLHAASILPWPDPLVYLLGGVVLSVLVGLILLVIPNMIPSWIGTGVDADFVISPEGVGYRLRAGFRDTIGFILCDTRGSSLRNDPEAGMVTLFRRSGFMKWEEMGSVTVNENLQRLVFTPRGLFGMFHGIIPGVIGVWCTRENFAAAEELVYRYAPRLPVLRQK